MLKLNKILACISAASLFLTGCLASYFLFEDPTARKNNYSTEKMVLLQSKAEADNRFTKSEVADWMLFGVMQHKPGRADIDENIKETSLSIEVTGVLSTPIGDGWAIASINKSPQKVVKKGDEIKKGIFVSRLTRDYIIVNNNGVSEKVTLQKFSGSETQNLIGRTDSADTEKEEGTSENPNSLLQTLRNAGLKRTSKDSASGYIVISNDKKVNTQFGLQEGDIINSVNGHPVGSDAADGLALRAFRKTGKASIEVSRDGNVIYLEYPL